MVRIPQSYVILAMSKTSVKGRISEIVAIVAISIALGGRKDAIAQSIIPDESLGGERSQVTPLDDLGLSIDFVRGGAVRGANLFHSFLRLNVPEGRAVYFDRFENTQNILTRVTGQERSEILGTLGITSLPNSTNKPSLFLVNPSGITFGKNARLDVPGSFIATTADAIRLGDMGLFSASEPEKSSLLDISPSALLFHSINPPAQIINQSAVDYSSTDLLNPVTLVLAFPADDVVLEKIRSRATLDSLNFLLLSSGLQAADQQTIALIGGNLVLDNSSISAIDGKVELASIGGAGSVTIQKSENGFNFGYEQVPQFDKIQILESNIVTSGRAGGTISIRGSQVKSSSENNLNYIAADTYGAGKSDRIAISAPTIILRDTLVSTSALQNKGGDMIVSADSSASLFNTNLRARAYRNGSSGDVLIRTQKLFMDQSELTTSAQLGSRGNAGNIRVIAPSLIQLYTSGIIAAVAGTGNVGNLTIETGKLTLEAGGTLSIQGITREGKPGNIDINAAESVDIIGVGEFGRRSSITSEGLSLTEQPTGSIKIQTRRLTVRDGGEISLNSVRGGTSRGGNLVITATDRIEISGVSKVPTLTRERFSPSIIAATASNSPAGNITLQTGELLISDGAEIRLNSEGIGNAGSLKIEASNIQMRNGKIFARSESGQGGNLQIQVDNLLLLRQSSQISTTAGNNQTNGNGGNIDIAARFVVAIPKEDSNITADAFRGEGGRVTLNIERGVLGLEARSKPTSLSDITASSEQGAIGVVTLNTPSTDFLQNSLTQLPQNEIDTNTLLANSCIARNRQNGSFYITGTGGLPTNPGEISPYATGTVQAAWKPGDLIVEPQGVYSLPNGQLVMSRECDRQ
jgi:filamentous hemagglutinin family protein